MTKKIQKRHKTFVLIIPRFEDISHSFYAGEIIRGACFAASRIHADIVIHITDRTDHRGWLDSSLLDINFVDGIVFADIDNDVNVVKKAINHGMPCMVLNNILNIPINFVAIDNKGAAKIIVDHLVQLGHKRIATIAGDLSTQAGHLRLDGFEEALNDHGLECPKGYVTFGHFLRTPARDAAEKLLSLKNRPTAVFAASDVMALELMAVAKAKKIKIPQELSIVGFDDNPLGSSGPVPLTTMAQPLIEMGRMGVEQLYLVCQGKARLPIKIVLTPRFIVRDSTQNRKKKK